MPEALLVWFCSSIPTFSFTVCSRQFLSFLPSPTEFSIILKYIYIHLLNSMIFQSGFIFYICLFGWFGLALSITHAFLICLWKTFCMYVPSTASLPQIICYRDTVLRGKAFSPLRLLDAENNTKMSLVLLAR